MEANHEESVEEDRKIAEEPNWQTGDPDGYPCSPCPEPLSPDAAPVQQSDLLKPLYLDIANFGLMYAFHKYKKKDKDPSDYKKKKTENKKHVIIIGAGMAGLVAAYELSQAGHEVTILEQQMRVGGRVKTYGEKDGFGKGLHVDGESTTTGKRESAVALAVVLNTAMKMSAMKCFYWSHTHQTNMPEDFRLA